MLKCRENDFHGMEVKLKDKSLLGINENAITVSFGAIGVTLGLNRITQEHFKFQLSFWILAFIEPILKVSSLFAHSISPHEI